MPDETRQSLSSLKRRLPGCHRKPGQASLGPTLVEGPLKLRSALVADPLKLGPIDSMGPLKSLTASHSGTLSQHVPQTPC